MIKNSFMILILLWNWKGYKGRISLDEFIKDYRYDFEQIKDRIAQINKTHPDKKNLILIQLLVSKIYLRKKLQNVY